MVCAFCATRVASGRFFKSIEYLNKPPVNAPGMRNLAHEPDRPISHYLTLLLTTIKAPGSDCLLPATTGLWWESTGWSSCIVVSSGYCLMPTYPEAAYYLFIQNDYGGESEGEGSNLTMSEMKFKKKNLKITSLCTVSYVSSYSFQENL